jgi:hypothetical protein
VSGHALLTSQRVRTHATSKQEVHNLCAVVEMVVYVGITLRDWDIIKTPYKFRWLPRRKVSGLSV